jgi:hypothetical protein
MVSPDGNVALVETLISVSAALLPSALLAPVCELLATAVGVAVADGVGTGVADGRIVGDAVGATVGVELTTGDAEGATEAEAVGKGDADTEAVGRGDALATAVVDGAAEGEAVVVLPGLTGVRVEEPPLQAVRLAPAARKSIATLWRRFIEEYIVNRSQARGDMPLAFNTVRNAFYERSHT